jgi:signal transduction histidine kinase
MVAARTGDSQARAITGCFLVALPGWAIAIVTSRASDWQPTVLVLAIVALTAASRFFAVKLPSSPWILTSTAPLAIAVALLGPAPAIAISAAELTIDGIRRRKLWALASNLATDSVVLVSGGLLARWIVDSASLKADDPGFVLLFLGIYAWNAVGTLIGVCVYERLVHRDPILPHLRRESGLLGYELPTAAMAAGAVYLYGKIGTAALALFAVLEISDQYSTQRRLQAEDRAAMLQKLSESRGRLVGEVLQAEQTERRRLAESLHDQALQELLFVRGALGAHPGTEPLQSAMGRAIEQLRGEIFDLHPAVLEHAGLAGALHEVADRQGDRGGFKATVSVEPEACGHHDPLLFVLGREQLTNVAKHAGASEVALDVGRDNGKVVMRVSDDGQGIDPQRLESAVEHGHVGLASSAERVEALGGELRIESEPGSGTRIRTTLPVRAS